MTGHVDEGEVVVAGSTGPGDSRDRSSGPGGVPRPAVGLHPGQRPDQRRLAVVDVPGGGDDVHLIRSRWRRGRPRSATDHVVGRGRSGGPAGSGRAPAGRPRRVAGAEPGGIRLGQRDRPARQARPGAPPPPTAPSAATTRAPTADNRSAIARRERAAARWSTCSAVQVGVAGPAQGRLQRGQGELVDPQRPGQRMAAQPLDHLGPAEQQAGLRAAEQLVAAGGDDGRAGATARCPHPARRAAADPGPAARCRCRRRPADRSRASSATGGRRRSR